VARPDRCVEFLFSPRSWLPPSHKSGNRSLYLPSCVFSFSLTVPPAADGGFCLLFPNHPVGPRLFVVASCCPPTLFCGQRKLPPFRPSPPEVLFSPVQAADLTCWLSPSPFCWSDVPSLDLIHPFFLLPKPFLRYFAGLYWRPGLLSSFHPPFLKERGPTGSTLSFEAVAGHIEEEAAVSPTLTSSLQPLELFLLTGVYIGGPSDLL